MVGEEHQQRPTGLEVVVPRTQNLDPARRAPAWETAREHGLGPRVQGRRVLQGSPQDGKCLLFSGVRVQAPPIGG
jgi:hypothetical protein